MKKLKKTIVFLATGSNLGNRKKNISKALELLSKNKNIHIIQSSKLLKNPPEEGVSGGYFLNGTVKIKTILGPAELLSLCADIEERLGRDGEPENRSNKEARTIDLDILFYGNKIIKRKNLKIPHPRLHRRNFVLKPLNEIAPDFMHPVFKKRIKELFTSLIKRVKQSA